jgi:hypothetical protein
VRRAAAITLFLLAFPGSPAIAAAAPPEEPSARPAPAPPPARAARRRDPPIGVALGAGIATAMIPLALGAMHTAGAVSDESRNAGLIVAGAGIALAPIAAHIVLGEWKRAAIFGAAPLAAEIATIAYLAARPDAVFKGTPVTRTAWGAIFSLDLFGAAIGLVDVMLAGERWQRRDLAIVPSVGQGRFGLALGGVL